MKNAFLIVLLLFSTFVSSQVMEDFQSNKIFKFINTENDKLIVFLHGGVQNPYFKDPTQSITLDYLLEENQSFIDVSKANNFDLIVPIVNDKFNWLDKPDASFQIIKEYINSLPKSYKEIYISGFSDGGTGSFKIFYSNPEYFNGLIVFNGYPQHSNFYKKVDYSKISDKKVLFFGTIEDETIPYEFLLTEYSKQKKYNPNTYLYVKEGNHSFFNYNENDLKELFDILKGDIKNTKTEVVHGYVKNDEVIEVYPYRKKILRMYNFEPEIFKENKQQLKQFKKKKKD